MHFYNTNVGACLQAHYLLDCKSSEGKFPCVNPLGTQHNPAHAMLSGCVSAEWIKEETQDKTVRVVRLLQPCLLRSPPGVP